MGVNYNCTPIVTNGLVAQWDAANPRSYPGSGSLWYNIPTNRAATLNNSPTFDSSNNKGYFAFNGTASLSYVDTFYVPAASSFTMAGFVRSRGSNGGFSNRVFGNADSSGGSSGASIIFLDASGGTSLYLVRRAGSNDGARDINYNYGAGLSNVWHYVAQTYDASTGSRLYVDARMLASNPTTGFTSSLPFRIGRDGNASDAFKGDVGIVHIYNRALSNAEMAINFNAYRKRYGL